MDTYVAIHGKNISHNPLSSTQAMSIDKLFPALLECFGIILCGYIAGRTDIITSCQAKGLGNFVSKFALPALLFKNMVLLDFNNVIWSFLWSILIAKVSVFVLVCVLTLAVASPESRYSKAGLYSIFATQSNDFALGYPIGEDSCLLECDRSTIGPVYFPLESSTSFSKQSQPFHTQCILKVFRPLDLFHVVTLQPNSKNDYIVFSVVNLHTIPHNDKAKTGLDIFAHLFKKYIYHISISIQTLYSVLCWSTFGSDYSLESSWVWRYKLGEILPFISADPLKLCQVGWGASQLSYFQVSPEMLDRVQVQSLAGPLKDIQRLFPKPHLRCLGCVLRVVVLLEGEPSPQSEVMSAPEQVFIKDLSVLCSVHLSLDPNSSPSPCCWKTSPLHDAATNMLHCREGARPKSSILVSSDQGILFLMVWESFSKLQAGCRVPFTKEWLSSCHSTIKAWLVEYCRDYCPSGRFSDLHRGTLELCQSGHWVLGYLPDQGPSPPIAQFGRAASSRRGPYFIHLRRMGAAVFLGFFNAAHIFCYPSPDHYLDPILSWSSTDNSFDHMAWFLLWHAVSTVWPYIDRCVPLPKHVQSIEFTKGGFQSSW